MFSEGILVESRPGRRLTWVRWWFSSAGGFLGWYHTLLRNHFLSYPLLFVIYHHPVKESGQLNRCIYGLDIRGSTLGRGKRFSVLRSVHSGSWAHVASYTLGTWCGAPSPRVKRQGREADHSPPSSELYFHSTVRFHDLVLNTITKSFEAIILSYWQHR
jgi:hypothetical protein